MKLGYYNIIRGLLFIIVVITSYYVLTAGYNSFVTFRSSNMVSEGFQGGCHEMEYAQFTSMCADSIRGSGANRPVTPQMKTMSTYIRFLRPQAPPKKPNATEANAAFLRLLTYINPQRNTQAAVPFRDMIKCLFFTCDSYVKVVPDLMDTVNRAPLLFAGAKKSATILRKPADDLRTVLEYLDTRRSVQDEPLFFTTLRDLFMAERNSTIRNDIEFGRLSQLVYPEHVFRGL